MIDSLQLTDGYSVAPPANWNVSDDTIIVPSLQDREVLKKKFPKGYPVVEPYLRITTQPDLKPVKEYNEFQTDILVRHRHGG